MQEKSYLFHRFSYFLGIKLPLKVIFLGKESMAVSATPKVSEFELAIRDEVRAWMGRRGLTGRDLAKILGIAQPNVSKKLNGINAFSINDLGTIAGALGITLGDLLGGVARSPIIVPDIENPAPASPERGETDEDVRPVGLEPTTHGLKVRCSTN